MAGAGSDVHVAYGWAGQSINKLFGGDTKITGLLFRNNLQKMPQYNSRRFWKAVPKQFEGSLSLEFSWSNPWWLYSLLGGHSVVGSKTDGGVTLYRHRFEQTSNPRAMDIVIAGKFLNENKNIVLKDAVVRNAVIRGAVAETSKVRLDLLFRKAEIGAYSLADISESYNPFVYWQTVFTEDIGKQVGTVQSIDMSIANNTVMQYGLGDRHSKRPIHKAFDIDISESVVMDDTSKVEDVLTETGKDEIMLGDDFEKYNGGFGDWDTYEIGGNFPVVETGVVYSGSKSVKFPSGVLPISIQQHDLKFSGVQDIMFYFRVSDAEAVHQGFIIYGTKADKYYTFMIQTGDSNNHVWYVRDGVETDTGYALADDTWYKFRIRQNLTDGCYSLWVNNELIIDKVNFMGTWIDPYYANLLCFYQPVASCLNFYLDKLSITKARDCLFKMSETSYKDTSLSRNVEIEGGDIVFDEWTPSIRTNEPILQDIKAFVKHLIIECEAEEATLP